MTPRIPCTGSITPWKAPSPTRRSSTSPPAPRSTCTATTTSPGVKLYIKRVFITESEKELLPVYLRFVRGIIDSEDLPLNVSREILQKNRVMENIRSSSVRKILQELALAQRRTRRSTRRSGTSSAGC